MNEKEDFVKLINEHIADCTDISLLDLILKILIASK